MFKGYPRCKDKPGQTMPSSETCQLLCGGETGRGHHLGDTQGRTRWVVINLGVMKGGAFTTGRVGGGGVCHHQDLLPQLDGNFFHLNPPSLVLAREGDIVERVGFIHEGMCSAYAKVPPRTAIKSAQVSTRSHNLRDCPQMTTKTHHRLQ